MAFLKKIKCDEQDPEQLPSFCNTASAEALGLAII
jgi:hypothetical protein